MMEENQNYDIIEEEVNEEYSNDDLFNITSFGTDPSVRELVMQYEEGEIEKPELQRKYVWTKKIASRFIESLLLGLPVPSIFLANTSSGKRLIIDGYQRIRTLYDYIVEGVWHGDDSIFRLSDSDLINKRWRNLTFKELSDVDKRRLRTYAIHAIVFEQKKPSNDSGMFQIFERINTSGMVLKDQEVRNCVYQGKYNSMLFEINRNPKWRILFGDSKEHPRMLDLEFILRFFAMDKDSIYNSSSKHIVLKQILNDEMADHQNDTQYINKCKEKFLTIIDFIYNKYGEEAFFNLQKDLTVVRKRFYPTIFDSIMIATSIAFERGFVPIDNGKFQDKRMSLVKDIEYRESITQGTMQVQNIKTRIGKALQYLYGIQL